MLEALNTLGFRIVGVLSLAMGFALVVAEVARWHRRRGARKGGRRG